MTSHHYLTAARCSLVVAISLTAGIARAQQPLLVYGPGGPAPAMKEAAAAFEHTNGIKVTVTAGPTPSWIDHAKQDAHIIYSGSETMMTDFTLAMGGKIQEASITPLYMRPLAILVRPGNPKHLRCVADLMQPGVRLLVVNGAGQNGVWEDMAGRKVRANIASYAPNSASARVTWTARTDIDA
jgi:accessory colonization factor AcfC